MRRHFISVLGTEKYETVKYGTTAYETAFKQEAIIHEASSGGHYSESLGKSAKPNLINGEFQDYRANYKKNREWEKKSEKDGGRQNKVFVNFTNHPSAQWKENQRKEAEIYGDIIDIPFPTVSPSLSEQEVSNLASKCLKVILDRKPAAVLCQGEFTLSYKVIVGLQKAGIKVLAACSDRNTELVGDVKKVIFCFVKFREYEPFWE